MKKEYRKCKYCKGKGKIKIRCIPNIKRKQARAMYKVGIGFRMIGRALGIDHPQKVKSMILAKTK